MDFEWLIPFWLTPRETGLNESEELSRRAEFVGPPHFDTRSNPAVQEKESSMGAVALSRKAAGAMTTAYKNAVANKPEVIDAVVKRVNVPGFTGRIDQLKDYVMSNKLTSLLVAAELGEAGPALYDMIVSDSSPEEKGMLERTWDAVVGNGDDALPADGANFNIRATSTSGMPNLASDEKLALIGRLVNRFEMGHLKDLFTGLHTLKPADFVDYERSLQRGRIARTGYIA